MSGRYPQAARLRAIAGALAEPRGVGVAGSEAELATTRWELVPAAAAAGHAGRCGLPQHLPDPTWYVCDMEHHHTRPTKKNTHIWGVMVRRAWSSMRLLDTKFFYGRTRL